MRHPSSLPTVRKLVIELSVAVLIGVTLALLRPFGSTGVPFSTGLIFWLAVTLGGYLLFRPVMLGAARLAEVMAFPRLVTFAAATLASSVPLTILVSFASRWAFGSSAATFGQLMGLYGNVLVISAGVTLIYWLMGRSEAVQSEPQTPTIDAGAAAEQARFLDRLPPHLGAELIALQMEDHYVRAHTAKGSALILLRMRDAATELAGIPGAQVHRSWWVARAAVLSAEVHNRNIRLRLTNGLIVPVARNSVAALAAAGWPVQTIA
jgi:LytTr DNA-binding domain